MKKILIALAFIIIFTSACSYSDDGGNLLLSAENIGKYSGLIENMLSGYKWNYDKTSETYEVSAVIGREDPRYEQIYEASMKIGLDILNYNNREAVAATAVLLHFNGESAGRAFFYILNKKIVCAYYVYNSDIYSINDRNVFVAPDILSGAEDTETDIVYSEESTVFDYDDYTDISSSGSIAVIDQDLKLKICDVNNNSKVLTTVNFSDGFYPMDFKFTDDGAVALLGKNDEAYENADTVPDYEEEETSRSTEELYRLKSWKVVFLDARFRQTKKEIPLDVSKYKTLNLFDGKLFLSRDNTIDVFEINEDSYERVSQIRFRHDINKLIFADIDGSGKSEMVIIDGKDLYIYSYEDETTKLIWKSYLDIESMKDSLYVADTNDDGIQEIYIEDLSETTVRYVLGDKGFKTLGKEIKYEYKYIPGDYNNDGKIDFIVKNMQTQETVLKISEGIV